MAIVAPTARRLALARRIVAQGEPWRGRDDIWIAELRGRYDGGPWNYGVSILEFRGDKVARETIYVTDAWEAPEWRSRWWAEPPNPPQDG